eukprot:gnl/MRDRNA2_/MRDRNA2_299252_c0_seq1.p1 gnl/MRDRNA2_/MRDRNA2_299252_c0~~gnl/MRDRNA2_/MRDRNA2_299252_c0_seq1.p1  ORF type:complete len:334 (-),score=46.60 gnl/MRDRNA2_/MRDRNA2_299252_c0_seq1:3-914(-)
MRDPLATKHFTDILEKTKEVGRQLRPPLTDNETTWAYSIAFSRMWDIQGKKMLLPGIDLFNHNDIATASFPQCSSDQCVVTASQPIKRGEQIWVSYGEYSNLDLLIRHGFTTAENPFGPRLTSTHTYTKTELKQMPWLWKICRSGTLNKGPLLRKRHAVSVEGFIGTVIDHDIRCLFMMTAFDDTALAAADVHQLAEIVTEVDPCLPQNDPELCTRHEWSLASSKVHKALFEECAERLKRYQNMSATLERLRELKGEGSIIASQLLSAADEEIFILMACAKHHAKLYKAWFQKSQAQKAAVAK